MSAAATASLLRDGSTAALSTPRKRWHHEVDRITFDHRRCYLVPLAVEVLGWIEAEGTYGSTLYK